MKKRSKFSRILALVLTMSLVFQQAGITTLAEDDTSSAAVSVEETELTAAQTNETAAEESSQEETSAPETQAVQEETTAPETQAAQTETTAPETQAAQTETTAPETDAAEEETTAAQTDAADSAAEAQTDTAEKNSDDETDLEETTEAVTEEETKLAAKKEAGETSENTAEQEPETASEETTEAESGTETETEVETETDTEIETETETESESETETETEEYPDTFVWEDDEKTVTVVLSDPEALPLGAEFVVENLSQKEYDAYKALIIEQQFANDETYGETVEARTALAEVLLANLVLYDMYFVYEGTEIEPDANTMSVTIKNKKAVDVSTDEVVESDGYVFVQEEDADSSVVAIHVDESGKKEKVEEVTEDVKTNANGKVKTVELTVDSFSTIGYYPLTEYQQLPITDDTLINDWGGSYTLYFILNNYNIFTSGNAVAQHTVGAVAVGGTSSFTYGIGAGNYGTHPVPSYFQGGFVEGGFNSYIGGNAIYFTGYDSNVYSWAYQSYDVRFNDGGTGTIDPNVTHDEGYFIDFDAAMSAIQAEMNTYVNDSSNIAVDITNTGATLEDDHYTVTYNGSSVTVTIQSGYSYEFDDLDAIDYINIITSGDSQNVNIISKESGTVVLPKVLVNGSDPTGSETDYGCGLVFMLPNATTVDIGSKSNGTFLGHVIAPNAEVVSSTSGNTNGSFICASYNVPSMEAHMWHYNGSLILPDSHGFTAMKTLDGAAPTDADDAFTFTLYEFDEATGWTAVETATSAYGTGLVTFGSISYSADGTHWYLISEVTGDTTKYTFDDTLYLVKVVVTSSVSGTTTTYDATATYYKAEDGTSASNLILSSTTNDNGVETTTYSIDTSKLSELTLTSADDETSTIFTFGNDTITGSLWITKNVTVNGAATTSTDADGTYTFYVKDSSGNTVKTVTITITNGVSETVEVTGLPVGTYTVSEDVSLNPNGMSLTGGNDISVTVTENGTASTSTASFTNDMEKVGSLKITKNVTVNGEATTGTAADGTYTFQIYYYNESTQTSELKDTVTITIENGQSNTVQVDNLVEGKYYILEVLSLNPYGMELVGNNSIVVEVKEENTGDAIPVASFTNNLTQVGSLKITKNVTVNGKAATEYDDPTVADGDYTFYIIEESTGVTKADRTITIKNGVSTTEQVDNLEPGWYIVREYLTGSTAGMALTSGNDVRVYVYGDNKDDDGNTVINVAEFTNNKTEVGSLAITKSVTVNGDPATDYTDPTVADGTYTFYIVDEENNEVARTTAVIFNGVSSTVQVSNLEPGTYYVYEELTSNPTGMTLTSGNNGTAVVVTADNTSNVPTVEFVNDLEQVGSLKIKKNVTINGEDPADAEDPTAADGTYTFYVVDQSNNEVARKTITIRNGVSNTVQIDNLEPGVYYVYEYVTSNPSDVTLVTPNGVQVTVEADNTTSIPVAEFTNDVEDVGSLIIQKNVTVNGDPATSYSDVTAADGTYTFYVVDESNIEVARRNITIVNGVSNTAQIDNLVPGVYYVYEYLAGNPSGMALTTANGVQVTVTADDTATIPVVEFTNDKTAVGSIKITKNVTINGEDPTDAEDSTAADGTYTFYVVDDSNNEVARRNITIVNGESSTAQIDNLVPGTYYVYEYVTSNPSEVTLVTTNGVEVTVTANNTSSIPTAEFTNDVDQVGSLRITKNVTINGEDPADAEDPTAADGTYTFYVVDESNNEVARRNITIVNGESKTEQIDNLVPGVYYVYEYLATNPTDVTLVTANGVQVTVTADDTAEIPTAEFTNDVEDVGSLKITKNVTINSMDPSEAEDPTAADGTYTFYVVDESNNEVARRTITIVNGESKTEQIDNLVPGVYYVYEYLTSNPSGVTLATANGVQVTVTADDTAEIPTVEFTNDVEDVGSLKITKNVTINGEDPSEAEDATAADGTYTFYVVDKDNNEVARRNITIVNGESKTEQIDNLIPGTYYVYEYLASNPSGVTLVTTNGVEVKVTADDTAEIPTAEFTNDVEDVGSLKITKNVTINGEDPADTDNPTAADGSYTFLVEDEDGNEAARRTITIVNGESKTEQIDNLIPGKYIVKEVTSSLPDDITLISTNSVEVTVTADDTATIPTAVFTNNKYEAEFTLTATKKLTGRTLESGQFGFSITEVADATASAAAVANGFSGTATNDLNGTISFPAVTYTTSGTYYYKIAETVPADADKAAGYTYDTSYYIVTVTVTNDADNDGNADTTLTAAITAVAHYDEKGDVIDDVNASNLAESVVLTNKYAATGTLTLTAMKSLLASTASGVTLQANQFEFQVSGGKMASGSSVTAKNDADGKVDFGTVDTYDETDIGKTYTYDVSEVIPDPKEEGYTYDTVVYTVTVEVVDNGNGTLTADIKSIKASNNGYVQEMEFENLYTDGSEIFLKAYKTLEGRTMTDGQFSFTAVEVTDETGTTEMKTTDASGASANTYKSTVKNQAGEVIFDEISYEAGDVGDHYYKISEVIPSPIPDGYRYDTSYYIVTVNVTDKTATGGTATELSTSVTAVVHYDGNGNDLNDVSVSDLADAATFTNVYEASGDLSLEVTKTLNADETTMSLTDGQFTFKITEVDQYGTAVAGGYTETKTNDADGKVTFEKADAYDESDAGKTYYYQIEEVVTDSVNGFTYDTKVYTAAVTISDNGDGTLSTDITYTYSDGTDVNVDAGSIAFTNSYETKGEITFTAAKTLNYRTLPNNLFTFNLVQVDSNGDEVTGGFSSSAKNDANGNVTFETISYTTSGTYYYKVSESIGTLSYYDYDKTVYMVTVEVTDNGEGVLTAVVTKVTKTDANNTTTEVDLEGATPTTYSFGFENTYLASGTLDLEAAKILTTTETPLEAGQFTFEVSSARLTDSVTAANDAKGKATFTGVDSYDQTDIGKTYTYTVKEIIPSDAINNVKDGITYDTTEYTVYVKVVDQGRGKLGTEITYEIAATQTAADAMTFSNIYTAEGQIYLKATKKLTNSTLTDDEFTFTAVEVDANGDEVSGGYSETAKNKAGTATFPVVTYEKSGTYYYKIAETNGGATYYTYDDSYYIVKVTVKDNSTGVLNPEITDVTHYDSQGNLIDDVDKTGTLEDVVVFTNNYIAKGSLSVEATKVLTSDEPTMVLTAGAFTFKITQVEADGSVTAGGYSEMKTNDADGKVTFAKTDLYDQTDIGKTYYYTVEEVIPDPQVNGYTYDSKIYTVAVAISDNGDGTLKTELTYTYSDGTVTDAQAKSILFTNTYATAGSITLSATKTLTGRTLTANQFSFTITEVDAAGTAVANGFTGGAANNAAGAVTFPAISYTKSGTYYYQIEEVNDGQSGYSYDSSVYTVTVTVTDDGEGSLTAEVTGVSKDGSAITNGTAADVVFANTYAAAGSLTLKATKSMARTDSALGTFEFVLTDVTGVTDGTGTVLQTVTNDTTGAITFAALNYTLDDAGKTYTYTVSEKTQTGTGYFFDETIYTVTVTAADNGDGTLKLTTTVTDGTGAEMTYTDTVMTFTNDVTSVKIRKIDVTTEEELPGATIRIVDENGTVIDEWVSTTEDHEVTGLIPGKTYTLRETVAPTGYDITTDTTFVLNTDGTIDTSKTTTTVKDGVLLVEDSMTVSATATISVTKNLTYQNEAIDAVDQIFYVGLYVDAACTNLYASKAIAFKNASSATVTFDGLEIGRTYYIAECDSTGAALASGVGTLADGTIFAADFGNGATTATATVTDGSQTTITFANEFYTMPGGFYKEGTLTITKKLLDPDGDALNSSEVFYAGIFADSSYTTLATNVSENIVTLDLAGSSSVSVEVGVSIGTGETVTLYVTEVDADGNPVADAADFAYEVSVDTTKVTLDETTTTATVTITNQEIEEVEEESEYEEETETETETETTAVQTGDDTPLTQYIVILILALAIILMAVIYRRREREIKN